MTKYNFKKHREESNEFDTTTVEITCETNDLIELVKAFEEFLYACGFGVIKLELEPERDVE